MKSSMQTTQLLLLNILMMSLFTHSSAQSPGPRIIDLQVQNKVNDIRELAIIKAHILRRLGVSEPPLHSTHAPRPEHRAIDNTDYSPPYKLLDLVGLHSEPSDEFADDKIIQFQLGGLTRDKTTVIESVNLLLRLKYKKSIRNDTNGWNSDINLHLKKQSFVELIDDISLSKLLTQKKNEIGKPRSACRKIKQMNYQLP